MDLAEPQAVCLQARFLPEGVAQGTHGPLGNGQVAGLPQWTEVSSPRMNASHQVEKTSELPRTKPPHTGSRFQTHFKIVQINLIRMSTHFLSTARKKNHIYREHHFYIHFVNI